MDLRFQFRRQTKTPDPYGGRRQIQTLRFSDDIIKEVQRILGVRFTGRKSKSIIRKETCAQSQGIVTPRVEVDVVQSDPDDNRILECAVSSGSEYLVTGDKDLLRLRVYDSIRIVRVAEFIAMGQRR